MGFSVECENGTIVAAYPNAEAFCPHVGVALSHLTGPEARPAVLVARLNPDDARSIAAALVQSADRVQMAWDAYQVEVKADGNLDD